MDGLRLAVRDMKRRDWQALADSLPRLDNCKDLQRALKFFATGYGWQRLEGLPGDEHGRRYLRQIRNGLAGRPYRVGPFRVERAGRWNIVFVIDAMYAAQRAPRRRRSRAHSSGPGGWDRIFQRLHEEEIARRFTDLPEVPIAPELPRADHLTEDPYGEEDPWFCSTCGSRCLEDASTGLPMACQNCEGEK